MPAAKTKGTRKKAAKPRSTGPKSPHKKGRVGRPPFRPTDEDRKRVEFLAAVLPQESIARIVIHPKSGKPIDLKTLRRHFREELDRGKDAIDAKVAQGLVQRALDLSHPQGAACAIFYAKTRMGWSETTRVEVDGKAGVLVAPGVLSAEDWLAKVASRNADAVEPGLVDPD